MSVRELKPTNCHFCGYLCAFTATVEDGRVVDLEPDTSRYPYDEKIVRGCRRWRMNLEVLDDPDRINYPLRRIGERGSNQWERISWDEALDDIAARLRALAEKHGPATLASAIGGPHASFWPLHRFMSLFGSPNNMGIGQICWNPRIWMDALTFGWTVEADIDPTRTEAVFIWGTNPAQSDNSAFWRSLIALSKSEVPLVVIDPRRTQVAARADLWLPVKPGTDCTLALGLIHVIVEENLIDRTFVERWCHGFDELVEHVRAYTPEAVAAVCGLEAADIVRAARIFGRARAAALVSGRGVDQIGPDVAPTHRAICCLRAITGNVDKPGACVLAEMSDFTPEVDLELSARMTDAQKASCLNTPYTPLQCYEGYEKVRALTERLGRRLPVRYLTSAHPDLVLKAMLESDPYPVRALIVEATNPLVTYADTNRVFEALTSLDLLVVLEYYLTPTASIADYVLPAAGAIERPTFQAHGGVANIAYGGPAAVAPYYERKVDYDVFRELGLRLGQGEDWPDETLEGAYARTLADAAMSWDEYCQTGLYWRPPAFEKHEAAGADGEPVGFATTTGKIELACEILGEHGGDRLPTPSSRAAIGDAASGAAQTVAVPGGAIPDEVAASGKALSDVGVRGQAGECLMLITGARKQPYNASMFLSNPDFRASYPHPLAEVSPQTAERLGLSDGDPVVLSNGKGAASFILKTAPMRDDIVSADYGWWFPERVPGAPGFGGMFESNINLLTDCSVADGEAMIGTWAYNAIQCTIQKADDRAT
ncbi:molybdopterin-containing oxidoreductase family protein [Raoultibacter phocaeensis]|uniref:molybdopterin-containing oxidoreductase family protein n=1 Tax=Raoultibacter phocaeensis TaxID=2479841 RepID=UPI0015D5F832|nr:molybdopterin-dependent oxidoreductase [Raoultibacter phocaeensis]